jgi:hypothetical protein
LVITGHQLVRQVPGVKALACAVKAYTVAFLWVSEKLIRRVPGFYITPGTFGQLSKVHFHKVMAGVENLHALFLIFGCVVYQHVIDAAWVPAGAQFFNKVFVRTFLNKLLPVFAYGAGLAIRFHHTYVRLPFYAAHVPVFVYFQHVGPVPFFGIGVVGACQVRYNIHVVVAFVAAPEVNPLQVAPKEPQATAFACLFTFLLAVHKRLLPCLTWVHRWYLLIMCVVFTL